MTVLENIRTWLTPLNKKISSHPYLLEAERGTLPLDKIIAFTTNQYYIIKHDVRSLALMVSRSTTQEEMEFFSSVLDADSKALRFIVDMAKALGLEVSSLQKYSLIPMAVAYAHYLTALAHFASPGEQTLALVVNLPVWGSNCRRLSKALQENYGITETSFLDLFSQPAKDLESTAQSIINNYQQEEYCLKKVAGLIQGYELMFWNGIYGSFKNPLDSA